MRKVGIFGGTFNPPHLGHVSSAEAFVKYVDLDELIIMPDYLPPHKVADALVSADDRMQMCNLAFSHIDKVKISDLEISRGGKSYTAVTLTELSSPDTRLYFLCGTDMFLTLDRWYDFKTIFNLAVICYVRRESDEKTGLEIERKKEEYKEKYNASIIEIPSDVVAVSSSELRGEILCGRDNRLLPKCVCDYIEAKGLYK